MPRTAMTIAAAAALAIAAAGPPLRAQPDEPDEPPAASRDESPHDRIQRLNREWLDAFNRADWTAAEQALRSLAAAERRNPNHPYNLACVFAQQNRIDEANGALLHAVARGFSNLEYLESDPHLRALHGSPNFELITSEWDRFVSEALEARLANIKEEYGPAYQSHRDQALHLAYVYACDEVIFDRTREEIERLHRWWSQLVLPEEEPSGAHDGASPPWVTILLPTHEDYMAWAFQYAGPIGLQIGGAYMNDEKLLVAKGLGANLRHEFWHVLHWRHMNSIGQRHPHWVMEGLCSVVEDVRQGPDGTMVPLPSWRTNTVRRLARAGRLTDWERLLAFDVRDFRGSYKLSYYAQSRAIFMFLLDRGLLRDWYASYVGSFGEDPTGAAAFVDVFGAPLEEIQKQFRAWARDLPEAPEEIRPGMTSLPFQVEETEQGLMIASIVMPRDVRRAGLKARDVIIAIDGEPVREMHDLVRIMVDREPGTPVDLQCIRRDEILSARIELVEAR